MCRNTTGHKKSNDDGKLETIPVKEIYSSSNKKLNMGAPGPVNVLWKCSLKLSFSVWFPYFLTVYTRIQWPTAIYISSFLYMCRLLFAFQISIVFQEQTVTKALETSHEMPPDSQWRTLFTWLQKMSGKFDTGDAACPQSRWFLFQFSLLVSMDPLYIWFRFFLHNENKESYGVKNCWGKTVAQPL